MRSYPTPAIGKFSKFSPAEIAQLDAAIQLYRVVRHISIIFAYMLNGNLQNHDLTDEHIHTIILRRGKIKEQEHPFWNDICTSMSCRLRPCQVLTDSYPLAAAIIGRPLKHIRAHLQRRYNPSSQQGKWTTFEDKLLIEWVFVDPLHVCLLNTIVISER